MYRRSSARLYQLLAPQIADNVQACSHSVAQTSRAAADAGLVLWQAQLQACCSTWLQQLGARSLRTWSRKTAAGLGLGLGKQQQRVGCTDKPHVLLFIMQGTLQALLLKGSVTCVRDNIFHRMFICFAVACSVRRPVQARPISRVQATRCAAAEQQ